MSKILKIEDAAKLCNRTVKCLQLWDRKGILKAQRTDTNRRFYTEEQINQFLGLKNNTKKKNVAYCRVSSNGQKQDLKNQKETVEQFCINAGIANVELIEEIGGGLNFKRKKFYELTQEISKGNVSKLILAHKDRFCRFGFEYFEQLCEDNGCEILVINKESLSPQEEMVQDLMTIVHCFSSRLYGLRNYKKSLKEALKDESCT